MSKKLITVLLLTVTTAISALEVSIKFPDLVEAPGADGREIPTATLGDAFTFDIEISDANEGLDAVEVEGGEIFRPLGKSVMHSSTIINGKQSTTHTIRQQVKVFKVGKHKVGPVRVRSGSSTAMSGEFFIQVEQRKQQQKQEDDRGLIDTTRPHGQALEVELIPAKKEVYWGEPFEVTIRYIAHDNIYQFSPEIPEQGHFFKKDMQNKGWRKILRNGAVKTVCEQVITFLPVKTGATMIGPMKVHYTVPVRQQHANFGGLEQMFSMAFGPQAEQKEVDAAAVQMLVKPLPKTKKQVSLVGNITGFDIAVDKPTVQVNEPIKLTVNITGCGNLEFTEEVPLSLPAGCKVFKAKTSMQEMPGQKGMATKKIEYVLQVNKSGRMEFPAQQLTYFDAEAVTYKTISSQPIELFLTGDVVAQPAKTVDELAREVNEEPEQEKKEKGKAFIFDEVGHGDVAMTWWIFLLFLLLPLGLYVRTVASWFDKWVLQRFKKQPKAQDIIKQAEKDLAVVVTNGNAAVLHQFFIKLLANLWQEHEQNVTEQIIEQRLALLGWDDERIREFVNYLQLCASLNFTRQADESKLCEMLLKKAQYWVLLLGK